MKSEVNDMEFEEAMVKLEEIASVLEKGDLKLDESVKRFEEGMDISKKCLEILENAEKKISILIQKENGSITEENFGIEN